jgi:hypothetical protein
MFDETIFIFQKSHRIVSLLSSLFWSLALKFAQGSKGITVQQYTPKQHAKTVYISALRSFNLEIGAAGAFWSLPRKAATKNESTTWMTQDAEVGQFAAKVGC